MLNWMRAKLLRGATAVALVGTVGVAVVVVNGGPAQASGEAEIIQLIPVAAAGGGLTLVANPVTAAGICVGTAGVGCAVIGAAVLGAALYATKDVTVPFYRNLFGIGSPADQYGTPGTASGSQACGWIASTQMPFVSCTATALKFTPWTAPPDTYWGYAAVGNTEWTKMRGDARIPPANNWMGIQSWISTAGGQVDLRTVANGGAMDIRLIHILPSNNDTEQVGGAMWIPALGATMANPRPGAVLDENMQIQTTVQCQNPDGSRFDLVGTSTLGNLGTVNLPTCTGAAGAQVGSHGRCASVAAGLIGGALAAQSSNCASADAMDALYPNCVGGQQCTYVVKLDGVKCTAGGPCAEWAKLYAENPNRIACNYGSYLVPVAQCGFMERVYEADPQKVGKPGTGLNTDGNPNTWTRPGPNGQPGDSPATNPVTNPNIAPPPLPIPPALVDPSADVECFPGGFSLTNNPVEWVLQPVKCALRWAFVPKSETMTDIKAQTEADVARTGVTELATAIGVPLGNIPGSDTGCLGPGVTLTPLGITETKYLFSACEEPIKSAAMISHAFFTVVIVIGGGLTILRLVGAGFGYNVALKGGGDEPA